MGFGLWALGIRCLARYGGSQGSAKAKTVGPWGLGLRDLDFGFWTSGFRLLGFWASGFRLSALGFGLWALGFGLRAPGFGLWAFAFGLKAFVILCALESQGSAKAVTVGLSASGCGL